MKKLALLLMMAPMLLCGCQEATPAPVQTQPSTFLPAQTQPETTPSAHSPLHIEGISTEDVITYFREVCLNAEFVNSGDPSFLQKWNSPIRYVILGQPTREDLDTVESFAAWLNTLEGFPGMTEAEEGAEANLRIHFCSQEEMISLLGENFHDSDGGVTFWYEENAIYDAIVCCRTDLEQPLRNSVILEELYNGLGPIQDTSLRPDSIIWQEFSSPQALTAVDALILRLTYHPEMTCGMNAAECEAVIRELYY